MWYRKMLKVEWLGQTAASLCWIISVFLYGISSAGDALQLAAATCWMIANVAALFAGGQQPSRQAALSEVSVA